MNKPYLYGKCKKNKINLVCIYLSPTFVTSKQITIMEYEELKDQLNEIDKNCERQKVIAIKNYLNVNNPYKLGDIITDGHTVIKIEKLAYYLSIGQPCMVYNGVQLKKDFTISKRQNDTQIYGNRKIEKLN